MAKQRAEINTFSKGIIGSPSETDIPKDAASYSVNIDPNTEDGALRAINQDAIFDDNEGFVTIAYAKSTIKIKRTSTGVDNGSSTYDYQNQWFDISLPNDQRIYIWFDVGSGGSDPVVAADISDSYTAGFEVDLTTSNTITEIRNAINTAIGGSGLYVTLATSGDDSLIITSAIKGRCDFIDIKNNAKVAQAKITVSGNPTDAQTFTLTDTTSASKTFEFDTATTTVDGSLIGSNVGIGISGATGDNDAIASRIASAINGENQTYVQITAEATGATVVLTQAEGSAGNTDADFSSVSNIALAGLSDGSGTANKIEGGVNSLIHTEDNIGAIEVTNNTVGLGTFFPANNMAIINSGSADNGKDIYDIIGIDYDSSNLFILDDVYANENSNTSRGSYRTLASSLDHNNDSTFTIRNKAAHLGLGHLSTTNTMWVGKLDKKQFKTDFSGYYVLPDKLDTLDKSLAPANLDHIISFPMTYDVDGRAAPFSMTRSFHAKISGGLWNNTLNYHIHDSNGEFYKKGDGNENDINEHGKENNTVPKLGWVFRLSSSNNDTLEGELLAAKRKYFDASAASVVQGDTFQIVDQGTDATSTDAVVKYLGYLGPGEDPKGAASWPAFSYGMQNDGKTLYRISNTSSIDTAAFTNTGSSATNTRWTEYDLSDVLGDSVMTTIATCTTPITSGETLNDSKYLTYGDGTVDRDHVSNDYCRGLHQFLWITDDLGNLLRVNILDLDKQHHDSLYHGPILDETIEFNYDQIAKATNSSHSNNFKKWYAPVYQADKAKMFEGADGSNWTSARIAHDISDDYEGSDWASSVSWSREPSSVKIVGVCETTVNRTDVTLSNTNDSEPYVFELSGEYDSAAPDETDAGQWDGIAHKFTNGSNYTLKSTLARIDDHGFDTGQVLTFYNTPTSNTSNNLNSKMLGNSLVHRVMGTNFIRVAGDRDGKGSSGEDVGVYCSKVWVLFAKRNGSKFSRWDLFLYNYYPTTVTTEGTATMYDRTPPYSELGIQEWNGTGAAGHDIANVQDTEYQNQSGDWEVGIDKESVLFYDAKGYWNEGMYSTEANGKYVDTNHSWGGSHGVNHFRKAAFKRRDGTCVLRNFGWPDITNYWGHTMHCNWGDTSGWYGASGSSAKPREFIPFRHSLHPVSTQAYRGSSAYMQSVSFVGKVSGKFCTRGGLTWSAKAHPDTLALHIGSKWKTYNNDIVMFTLNENGADIDSTDTRLLLAKYDTTNNGVVNSYFEGESGNRASHYYWGGRFRNSTDIGGDTSSTYDGTLVTNLEIPYSNSANSGTIYQGQIGDYMFIDRKWIDSDPDIEHGSTPIWYKRYSSSTKIGFKCMVNNDYDQYMSIRTLQDNNWRPAEGWSVSSSDNENDLRGGVYGSDDGYICLGQDKADYDKGYDPDNPVTLSAQFPFHTLVSRSGDTKHGPYSWDGRRYIPAFRSLEYRACRMRELEQPHGSYTQFRSTQHFTINDVNSSADGSWNDNGDISWYGSGDDFYIVNGNVETTGDNESSLVAYQPNMYTLEKPNSYYSDSSFTKTRGYTWYACGNEIRSHSSRKYTSVPKFLTHFFTHAGDQYVDTGGSAHNIGGILLHGQMANSDGTVKSFFDTGSFIWNWDSSGVGNGYMGPGYFTNMDGYTPMTIHDSFITIEEGSSVSSSTEFPANENIYYKVSFLYDGYQEGPLSPGSWKHTVSSSARKSMDITLKVTESITLNPRISHVNVYRKVGINTLYRLVQEVPLEEGWRTALDGSLTYEFVDSKRTGSYEGITGISEELESTTLNYTLATTINDELFVGNCFVDIDSVEGNDARRYIFKSKPGNFSQFDITKDYLILDTIPTAISSFNGRVYAFDRNNIYRINPDSMFVEDTFNGVGCLSQNAIAVSEYGMCFADSNNVYLHDGSQPVQIANNITKINTLDGLKVGYQAAVVNTESDAGKDPEKPKIMYDGKSMSFVVFLIGVCSQSCDNTVSRAFAYNLPRKRWDYWEAPLTKQALQGQDSDILISDNEYLYNFKGGENERSWEHRTKQLSLTQLGSNKRFHRIKIYGSPTMSTISSTADPLNDNIVVLVDGVPQNLTLENLRYDKSYVGAKLYTTLNTTATSFDIVSTAAGDAPIPGSDSLSKGKYPEAGSYLMINDEIVKITARSNNTFTITRAQLGTTATAHTGSETGGNVRLYYIAPSLKLPSNCKGKKIEIQLKAQNGVVDGIGIEFINKGNS